MPDDGKHFYYKLWYDADKGRFEDIPSSMTCDPAVEKCPSCERKAKYLAVSCENGFIY